MQTLQIRHKKTCLLAWRHMKLASIHSLYLRQILSKSMWMQKLCLEKMLFSAIWTVIHKTHKENNLYCWASISIQEGTQMTQQKQNLKMIQLAKSWSQRALIGSQVCLVTPLHHRDLWKKIVIVLKRRKFMTGLIRLNQDLHQIG